MYQSPQDSHPIVVGTSAWFDWLEQHHAFLFIDRTCRFTAYKCSTDHDGQCWEAACTRHGTCSRIHLGQSHTLTLERLHAAAHTLAVQYVLFGPTEVGHVTHAASARSKGRVRRGDTRACSPRSLLHTKLYRPRGSSDVLARARLMERLNAALFGKTTLVCAPAGFGKTTLVSEWAQTIERPTAWLTLDEGDNELPVFVSSLLAALQTVYPTAFATTVGLLSVPQMPLPYRIATLLVNELAALPVDFVLVLDDYHTIRNPDVHALLEALISHVPPQVHVVLNSRSDPPLPLATWLAKGYLHIVHHADLRFTKDETKDFLMRVLGDELANATADALEECTEGWIAVIRLAALSLRGTRDATPFLERLRHCTDRTVSRYLLEEIFAHQMPDVQTILEHCSILEQFCAELCVAICGDAFTHEQVQSTLEALASSTPFLISLDDHEGWYRFHHLFSELLRQRLREYSSTEELSTLHQRASVWCAQQGLIEEALRHALAAGDAPGAAKLVEAHFHWALEQEGWMQMERWLRLLPEQQVQSSPILLLARAWILQSHGLLADLPPVLSAAERLLASSDSDAPDQADPLDRLLHAASAVCWCQFQYFTWLAQVSLESAERARRWNPPGEEYLESLATMYLALSQQATGEEVKALVTLQEALLDHAPRDSITARLLFAQALVFLAAGKLHQVEHLAGHLLRLAQQAELAMSHYWAHYFLGVVHYEWNNLDAAVSHFTVVVEHRYQAHAWAVQEAMYGLALAYQAQGLEAEAHKTALDLLDYVQEQHSQRDLLVAYAFYAQLTLVQDGVGAAEPWLAMAGEQAELVGPMTSLQVPDVTRVWMSLAQGGKANVARAHEILSRLFEYVQAIHSTRKTIQVLALQAWASALQGHEAEALDALERALLLARPGGFIRTFADLRALFPTLQKLRTRRGKEQAADHQMDAYLKRVLVAMNPAAAHAVIREELRRQEGLSP